jgi:hypothetical protein
MGLLWHVRVFTGLGAIFSALSELWFYPVSDVAGLIELVIVYAIAAHTAVLLVRRFGGGGPMGLFLAAVLLGFVVEGVPVFELFTALPFTLVWTSMAWHGLVSGLIGVWLYRAAAARGNWAFAFMNALFGASLGLWGAYFWGSDSEGLRYAEQLPWAWGLFALGHLVLPKATPPERFLSPILWAMVALVVFGFLAGTIVAVGFLALVLPLACAVTLIAVRGARSDADLWQRIPFRNAWAMPLMPIFAVLAFDLSHEAAWISELNAYAILVLGPLSVALLILCLFRAIKKGHPAGAL